MFVSRRHLAIVSGLLLVALVGGAAGVAGAEEHGAGCPASSRTCAVRTSRLTALLEDQVTGGSFGFVLTGIGGPILASWRADEGFYPASSIKALYLLEATR